MEASGVQSEKRSVVTVESYDDEEEDKQLPFIRIRPLRDLVRNPALFCPEEFQEEEEEEQEQEDEDSAENHLHNSLDLDKSDGVDTQEFKEDVAKTVQETFSRLDLGNAEEIHIQDHYDEEFSLWLEKLLEPKYPGQVTDYTNQDQDLPTDLVSLRDNSNDADATSPCHPSMVEVPLNAQETGDVCERGGDAEVELSQLIHLANSSCRQSTEVKGVSNPEPVADANSVQTVSKHSAIVRGKNKMPPRAGPASWKVRLMKRIREDEERAEAAKRLKQQVESSCEKRRAELAKSGKKPKVKKVGGDGPKIRTKGDDICKKNEAKKVHRNPVDPGKSPRPSKKQKTCPEVTIENAINNEAVSHRTTEDRKHESKNIVAPPAEAPPREESSDESDVPLGVLREKMLKAKKVREDCEETSPNEEELGPLVGSFDLEKPKLNHSKTYWTWKVQADAVAMWEAMRKPERDVDRLKKLLKRTFQYRQHQYNDADDLELILRNFPALRDYRLLKYDMGLLRKIKLETLDAKWSDQLALKYQAKSAEIFSASDPVIRSALEQLEKQSSDRELLRDIQLLCVGYQETDGKLHKNLYAQRLKKSQEPFKSAVNTPSIDILGTLGRKDTKISIYCESELVTKTPNLYEAVMSAYSLYWLLNLKYESHCIRFFDLLDSLVA